MKQISVAAYKEHSPYLKCSSIRNSVVKLAFTGSGSRTFRTLENWVKVLERLKTSDLKNLTQFQWHSLTTPIGRQHKGGKRKEMGVSGTKVRVEGFDQLCIMTAGDKMYSMRNGHIIRFLSAIRKLARMSYTCIWSWYLSVDFFYLPVHYTATTLSGCWTFRRPISRGGEPEYVETGGTLAFSGDCKLGVYPGCRANCITTVRANPVEDRNGIGVGNVKRHSNAYVVPCRGTRWYWRSQT